MRRLDLGLVRALGLGGVLALGVTCAASSASAQAGASTPSAPSARELFQSADDALHAGRFPEARDLLLRARALAPNAAIDFNLAVAYRGTGELLAAEDVLTTMLATYPSLAAAQRDEASTFLGEVRAEIGAIEVSIEGAESPETRLDGERIPAGSTRVDPGDHIVLVSATDRLTVERRVHVDRGEHVALAVVLEPTPESLVGTLVLDAPSPELTVEIEGGPSAPGHLEARVSPGEHRVRVRGGTSAREVVVVVQPRSETRYTFADPRGRSLVEEPLLWVITGVVIVGAGVGLAVGLSLPPPRAAPEQDPVFGIVMALEGP
ncbi:MAG: hypothetical protein U0234_04335 [Sandaracinus sp.]